MDLLSFEQSMPWRERCDSGQASLVVKARGTGGAQGDAGRMIKKYTIMACRSIRKIIESRLALWVKRTLAIISTGEWFDNAAIRMTAGIPIDDCTQTG
jgi:hypothetical protein